MITNKNKRSGASRVNNSHSKSYNIHAKHELEVMFRKLDIAHDSYSQSLWIGLGFFIGLGGNIGANLIYDLFPSQKIFLWIMFIVPLVSFLYHQNKLKKRFNKIVDEIKRLKV